MLHSASWKTVLFIGISILNENFGMDKLLAVYNDFYADCFRKPPTLFVSNVKVEKFCCGEAFRVTSGNHFS